MSTTMAPPAYNDGRDSSSSSSSSLMECCGGTSSMEATNGASNMIREANSSNAAVLVAVEGQGGVPDSNLDKFEVLGEDAVLSIFSYVGNAPLEKIASNPGSSELTRQLPEVSKFWQAMAKHDCLWKPAILRQLEREPSLWTEGLMKMVQRKEEAAKKKRGGDSGGGWNDQFVYREDESHAIFLERVREALGGNASYRKIYRHVLSRHIRQVLPVFYMKGHLLLGASYRLHMFEPRYRLLVAELLRGYPPEAKRGGLITAGGRPAPMFVHANRRPFGTSNSPACLVQLIRCNISPRDGTADVMLLPIAYIWLEKIWVLPDCWDLHYAQCIRMGQKATNEMHELINKEPLRSISRLADYGDYLTDDDDDYMSEEEEEQFGSIWE